MLKSILIDDEPLALRALENDLKKYCAMDVEILAACQSPLEGLKAIRKYKPDLVFLDVVMPGMNAFELLEVLGDVSFDIIFVSAYNEYAVDAFKVSAVHYLLKPINPELLVEAIARVKSKDNLPLTKKHLEHLFENINQTTAYSQRIGLPTSHGVDFVAIKDIMYCVAEGNFTSVYIKDKKRLLVNRALKELESLLPKDYFFRIHISHIVGKKHIERYERGDGGTAVMHDGKTLGVARQKKESFLHWLGLKDA
ncbi:MAG: LytR/AlgR family response regulator transcription factor [Saprospiraceae bacterium]